jgi:hypothetical protein
LITGKQGSRTVLLGLCGAALTSTTRKRVLDITKEHNADAIVWLSDRTVSSGSLKMAKDTVSNASLDTGRSSQPEIIISEVSQSIWTTYRKALRSSLLLVKWK